MEDKDQELEELKRRFKQNNYATMTEVIVYSTIISIIVWIACFFINYEIQKGRVEKAMKEAIVNFQKEQKRITDSIFEAQQSHINIHSHQWNHSLKSGK